MYYNVGDTVIPRDRTVNLIDVFYKEDDFVYHVTHITLLHSTKYHFL